MQLYYLAQNTINWPEAVLGSIGAICFVWMITSFLKIVK